MLEYERNFPGFSRIAGVDEAGRGPLAGPVSTAAVIMPMDAAHLIDGIDDSKKLCEAKREALYERIVETAIAYRVELIDEDVIDRINILQATKRGMADCINALVPVPDLVLVDAVKGLATERYTLAIIHGDALSYNIAAASILAKVTRDRLMRKLDAQYPQYGFARHKGYGTAEHVAAIRAYGPCPLHRRSFLRNILGAEA